MLFRSYALPWLARNLTERSGMHISALIDGNVGRLSPEIESCFFRVAQEVLQNSIAHSGSATASIHLRREGETLKLDVRDTGTGFGFGEGSHGRNGADGGIGLISMKERMGRIGGTLQISSSAEGTLIQASKALGSHDALREETAASDRPTPSVPQTPSREIEE